MTRARLSADELQLPACPLPRPGETVIWYSDCSKCRGTLLGHDSRGAPIVRNQHGLTQALNSFDEVRFDDDSRKIGPSWTKMGKAAKISRPYPAETAALQQLLARRIPPGPSYLELVQEIWHRGFEAFLVGGTVRDVISGQSAHDIDVVTSMPLQRALPLLTSMYRREPSINGERGFVRLGGTPASGDPFIDLKAMVDSQPGTHNAVFSSDIQQDTRHRDFACNAVYYDPINDAFLDPAGCGIEGAEGKSLELVGDPDRAPYYRAQIAIRFFKLMCRGYHGTTVTLEVLGDRYFPSISAMKRSGLVNYVRSQILNKSDRHEQLNVMRQLKEAMHSCGAGALWDEHFEPALVDILPGEEA